MVVMDAEQYDRLAGPKPELDLPAFLESLWVGELDLEREKDAGREVELSGDLLLAGRRCLGRGRMMWRCFR